jgi:hypothetical protein
MAGSPRFDRLFANDGRTWAAKLTEFYTDGSVTPAEIAAEAKELGDTVILDNKNDLLPSKKEQAITKE